VCVCCSLREFAFFWSASSEGVCEQENNGAVIITDPSGVFDLHEEACVSSSANLLWSACRGRLPHPLQVLLACVCEEGARSDYRSPFTCVLSEVLTEINVF
jgi:hypothetical protein